MGGGKLEGWGRGGGWGVGDGGGGETALRRLLCKSAWVCYYANVLASLLYSVLFIFYLFIFIDAIFRLKDSSKFW